MEQPDKVRYWLLLSAVFLLLVWPIWEVRYPSIVDYPDHLARVHILRHWNDEPVFQERYKIVPKPFPNLAIDLLGAYVFRWLDIYTAGKVILTLLVLLFCAGCHLLGRVIHGRPTWLAPLAALILYNSLFLYGFVNYEFGIAFFLLSLAAWLWYREQRSAGRFVLATLLATATYFSHLIGLGALGVSVAFLSVWDLAERKTRWKALALDLAILAPAVAIYASLGSNRGDTHTMEWPTLALKAKHAAAWLISYSDKLTVAYGLAVVVAVLIVLLTGRVRAKPSLLGLVILFWGMVIVFPAELFSGSDADARLAIPAVVLTLLVVTIDVGIKTDARLLRARTAFTIALVALGGRIVEIGYQWRAGDALTRQQLTLFEPVPKGRRILPMVCLAEDAVESKRERHILHAIEYTTIEKSLFFPQFISVVGQQPVTVTSVPYYPNVCGEKPESISWARVANQYDYIYTYRLGAELTQYIQAHYASPGRGSGARLSVDAAGNGRIYAVGEQASR